MKPHYQAYDGWNNNTRPQSGAKAPNAKLIAFVHNVALDYLGRNLKASKRHMYYRAAAEGLIQKGDDDYLNDQIRWALLSGELPWNAFTDVGRGITKPSAWENARKFLEIVVPQFRVPIWDSQKDRVVVMIEKDALLAVIQPICETYRVPFTAAKGDPGDVYLHEDLFEPYVALAVEHAQRLVIITLTDCNASGWNSPNVLRRKLGVYVETVWEGRVAFEVERTALTKTQIDAHKLTNRGEPLSKSDDPKKQENAKKVAMALGYPYDEQWDLDALRPDALQTILAKAIEAHREQKAWNRAIRFERREARKLKKLTEATPTTKEES